MKRMTLIFLAGALTADAQPAWSQAPAQKPAAAPGPAGVIATDPIG
jgi:hypothetical protein